MEFSDWLYQQECEIVRIEHITTDLLDYQGDNFSIIIKWLELAYEAGSEHHKIEIMSDGK